MRYLLDHFEMKSCDDAASSRMGIPAEVLMERAALAVADVAKSRFSPSRVLVLCGSGNNGGDGFAAARLLLLDGVKADALFIGKHDRMTEACRLESDIFRNYGGTILEDEADLHSYDLIIDALFGIGLSRDVLGRYADIINAVNACGVPVLAVDIPSGVSADSGQILQTAIHASATVTFAFEKLGHVLYPGASCCGEVICRNVGITEIGIPDDPAYTLDASDLSYLLPKRYPEANKGSCGKLLLIAGDEGMAGAAVMAAKSAYRSGCGMVCVCTHEANRIIVQSSVPEALFASWTDCVPGLRTASRCSCANAAEAVPESGNPISSKAKTAQTGNLEKWLSWADAVAVGPGLGTSEESLSILSEVLHIWNGPLIADADALNLVSGSAAQDNLCRLLDSRFTPAVLTPHPGEMLRLLKHDMNVIQAEDDTASEQICQEEGSSPEEASAPRHIRAEALRMDDILADPLHIAQAYATLHGVVTVLKGARTVVTDRTETMVNTCGNDGMATAGSGDCLSGIIGALLAQGMAPFDAAQAGVLIHALAGDAAAKDLGRRSMTAMDIAEHIQNVLKGQ